MEQRHEFDIERTTPMNILGHIMTGSISISQSQTETEIDTRYTLIMIAITGVYV